MCIKRALFFTIISFSFLNLVSQDRPNIIFILTDDQRWDALGHAGNEIIQTPEMDQLAREGTYFKNAFVTTPICAASRASIITGMYERKHNYTFGQPPLSRKVFKQSYFSLLNKAGYHTGFIGKFGVKVNGKLIRKAIDKFQPNLQGTYHRLVDDATKHRHLTEVIGDQAIEFINNSSQDTNFCLSISFHAPHASDASPQQYIWPSSMNNLYRDELIPGPNLGDDQYFERLPEAVKKGFNRDRWLWRFDTPEKYQEMVKGYYRMISGVDREVGKIRQALKDQNLEENTIIILMGDNGYFLGERQLAGKWLMYERSIRVPLIIYNPGGLQGNTIDDFALNIDVPLTMLQFADVDIPDSYQGVGLKSFTESIESNVKKRDHFLIEHLWDFDFIAPSEGIRTNQYKYFRYINDPSIEEVYDVLNDPEEINNLAKNSEFKVLTTELREQLDKLIESTRE